MTLEAILDQLKSERDRLDRAIAALQGTAVDPRGRRRKAQQGRKRGRRRMSAAARKRISEFKRKWWAERKKAKRG